MPDDSGSRLLPLSQEIGAADKVLLERRIQRANELKQEGNDHFRLTRWNEALAVYRMAVANLPSRPAPARIEANDADDEAKPDAEDKEAPAQESQTSEVEAECAKARAVLHANIAACYVKLGDHKEAVSACTQALLDDPLYVKALLRRAASNDKINTWSSLASAQEDYTKLLEILPPSSPQITDIKRSLRLVKPRAEQAQKEETAEMLDKLKGLGNSILGNFGLSTDNFKFEPNGQGGYSMNFSR